MRHVRGFHCFTSVCAPVSILWQFCATYFGGKFLEHVPEIEFKYDGTVAKTARLLQENGFAVDWTLWDRDALQCSPCAPGSNCH